MKRAHAETVAGNGASPAEVAAEVNGGRAKRLQVEDQAGALDQQVAPVSKGSKTCWHQISYPEGYVAAADKPIPLKPAKTYPFTLDPFQATAISCLEKGESMLVSAPASAGKTVVAEYAIAMSLRDNQRCIYTSPIIASLHQKYRELCEEFSEVGFMAGDVTENPNASVLVVTTEMLRSMLYRGSEVIKEVAWIIFDEVNYMRDKERGRFLEESILLVPDNARLVFLCTTVPNAKEFADWVTKIHKQPCHTVYTDFRPTPLQHYIFPAGGDGIFLVVDEKSKFREDQFQKAMDMLSAASQADVNKKPTSGPSDISKLVRMVMAKNYDPCIVFSFSKRECEAHALQMADLDFNDDEEKKLAEGICNNAMESLSDDDKRLPQVTTMLPLLRRGIGMHDSGLLPIIKEVTEILSQQGLLKALFATETCSVSLNVPAKTVIFTSVRKFDGEEFHWTSSGEYIQMSGRAGRRGVDDRGVVILMVDERMEPSVAKGMLKGRADTLDSSLHLSYFTLLNMLRIEDASPECLLRNSYKQFQTDRSLPELRKKVEDLEAKRAAIEIEGETELEDFYSLRRQLSELRAELRQQQVDSNANKKLAQRIETLEGMLRKHPQMKRADAADSLQLITHKAQLAMDIQHLELEEKSARSMVLMSELNAKRQLLKRLGYISEDEVVQAKGRVASEISYGGELVLTEMLCNEAFNELTPEETVALCSCFVWSKKVSSAVATLTEQLVKALGVLQDTALRVGKVASECKVDVDMHDKYNSFGTDLVEVVYAWARGAKFSEVLQLCKVSDSSLICALHRLEELLWQMRAAARVMGEIDLEVKFEDGIKRIKRGIVFGMVSLEDNTERQEKADGLPYSQFGSDHLMQVLQRLSARDLCQLATTCHRNRELVEREDLWQFLCRRDLQLEGGNGRSWRQVYREAHTLEAATWHKLGSVQRGAGGGEAGPQARASHICSWATGKFVVFGGGCDGGRHMNDTWTACIEWVSAKPICTWRRLQLPNQPPGRFTHSCATVGSCVIVYGGIMDTGARMSDTWALDLAQNEPCWKQLQASVFPPARGAAAACYAGGSRVIVHGGIDSVGNRLSDLWVLDLSRSVEELSWEETQSVGAPMGRSGHTLTWVGSGKLLMFGGRDQSFEVVGDTWLLDLEADPPRWIQLNSQVSPTGRAGHVTLPILGGRALLFGGEDSNRARKNDVWVIDPHAHNAQWREVVLFGDKPVPRSFHGGAVNEDGTTVLVFGGMIDGACDPSSIATGSSPQLPHPMPPQFRFDDDIRLLSLTQI